MGRRGVTRARRTKLVLHNLGTKNFANESSGADVGAELESQMSADV